MEHRQMLYKLQHSRHHQSHQCCHGVLGVRFYEKMDVHDLL